MRWMVCMIANVLLIWVQGWSMITEPDEDILDLSEIYSDLIEVIGNSNFDWPNITVLPVASRGASYVAKTNTIYVDSKLIDLCSNFGARKQDALAYIIGHELTHYYQGHEWAQLGLVDSFILNKSFHFTHQAAEKEADVFGTFFAKQAGYEVIDIMPKVLEAVYEEYKLPVTENENYPSLQDRQNLAEDAADLSILLYEAYQTANFALTAGQLDVAIELYEYVKRHLSFKEGINNLATAYMLAYQLSNEQPLHYAMLIDPASPLLRGIEEIDPDSMLVKAIEHFEMILAQFDSAHGNAYEQLVTCYSWQEEYELADQMAISAVEQGGLNAQTFTLNLGNYYAKRGFVIRAKRYYQSILQSDSNQTLQKWARENLNYIDGGKQIEKSKHRRVMMIPIRNIDGVPSLTFYNNHHLTTKIGQATFSVGESEHSYLTHFSNNHSVFRMQRVESEQVVFLDQIRVGAKIADVKSQVDDMTTVSVSGDISWFISWKKGLIVLAEQNLIKEWCLFTL